MRKFRHCEGLFPQRRQERKRRSDMSGSRHWSYDEEQHGDNVAGIESGPSLHGYQCVRGREADEVGGAMVIGWRGGEATGLVGAELRGDVCVSFGRRLESAECESLAGV